MTEELAIPPSSLPWLTVADEVLSGDHDEADDSTRESLRIGLARVPVDKCRNAVARLKDPHKKRERKVTAPKAGVKTVKAKVKDGGWW